MIDDVKLGEMSVIKQQQGACDHRCDHRATEGVIPLPLTGGTHFLVNELCIENNLWKRKRKKNSRTKKDITPVGVLGIEWQRLSLDNSSASQ